MQKERCQDAQLGDKLQGATKWCRLTTSDRKHIYIKCGGLSMCS